MRIQLWLVIVSGLFFSLPAFAQKDPCAFGDQTTKDILCIGQTKLEGTIVDGSTFVSGDLLADNAELKEMDVSGNTTVTESTIKNNVCVVGSLNANNGDFQGNLVMESEKIVLNNSNVQGSILVKSKDKTPILELHCNTQVSGGITFEGKPGIIKKSKNSKISGKVKNGSIEAAFANEHCVPSD